MTSTKLFSSVLIMMSFALVFLSACESLNCPTDPNAKEYTSDYVCAKHCRGSGNDKQCKCPKCGKMQQEAKSLEYTCLQHKEMKGNKGQTCEKCGKDLEKIPVQK